MIKSILILGFVAFASAIPSGGRDVRLPVGAITCQIDSAERDECIKEAIQDMLPKLAGGLSSLNIPPLDPFEVERTPFTYRRGNNIDISGSVRKVKIYGGSQMIIEDVKTDITKTGMTSDITVRLPHTSSEGFYRGEGRFNAVKVRSKGYFNVTADDVMINSRLKGVFEKHDDGEIYLRVVEFDMKPIIGKMKIYATGLLPDPELNRLTLEFLNQYWPFMYREIVPQTRNIWEPILIDETNKFLSHVPFRKMLYYSDQADA